MFPKTGNSIIDGDDGSHPFSPKYRERKNREEEIEYIPEDNIDEDNDNQNNQTSNDNQNSNSYGT